MDDKLEVSSDHWLSLWYSAVMFGAWSCGLTEWALEALLPTSVPFFLFLFPLTLCIYEIMQTTESVKKKIFWLHSLIRRMIVLRVSNCLPFCHFR